MRSLTLVLACAAAAGCGGADDSGSSGANADKGPVRAAVEQLYAAAGKADGERACRLVAPALKRQLERPPEPCAAEVLTRLLGPGSPRSPQIVEVVFDGSGARVVATDKRGHGAAERTYRHRLVLERSGGEWLVASAEEL